MIEVRKVEESLGYGCWQALGGHQVRRYLGGGIWQSGTGSYHYRSFGRYAWLASFRAWFGIWRHLHGWPEPPRNTLRHRVLTGTWERYVPWWRMAV